MALVYTPPILVLLFTVYVATRVVLAIPPGGGANAPPVVIVGTGSSDLSFKPTFGTAVFVLVIGGLAGGVPIALLRARGKARAQRDQAISDVAVQEKERRELEKRLVQAQKMESVGRLAGGIAHDFNNLLTVIMGQTQFAMLELPDDHPVRDDLLDVVRASERAAGLTRQLLAFSRQQVFAPTVFSLNDLVTSTDKMLQRMIGEDVHVVTHPSPGLGMVRADRGQLEQVLMNLAVNARDAMPEGGELTIETSNATLDETYAASHPTVSAGDYVLLAVTDTGTGMTEQVQSQIFEPFFTTKPPGQGTGLGLATVFGIVKQSGGHVAVYSEVGMGTTFKVYLPRVAAPATVEAVDVKTASVQGSETILLAEDDRDVRRFAQRALERAGYRVFAAEGPARALELARDLTVPIDVLFSDVVMPDMSGPELARQIQAVRPGIRVLFASGYTGEAMAQRKVLESGVPFIQKPFTAQDLAAKLRALLDSAG